MDGAWSRKPAWPLAAAVTLALVLGMSYLCLSFDLSRGFPLAYAFPLFVGLWHRDRVLLWAMAGGFMVVSAIALMPGAPPATNFPPYLVTALQWLSIALTAGVVQLVLGYRQRLEEHGRASGRPPAENAPREARDLLGGALNATPMLVACMDREFNFLLVNRAYAEADGREPEEFPGKNHFALYPHAENEAIFRQVVASGKAYDVSAKPFEYPGHPERGVTYWNWSVVPIKDAAGRVERLVMTLLDVTARVRAENELRESEKRLGALIHASSEVLYRMNADWSEMRELHSRGSLASLEEPSRTWLQQYIPPDDQPQVIAAIEEAIRTRGAFELEHRVRQADGSLGWTFSRAVPVLGAGGEIVEWFGAANDITGRKRAEERLQRAKAAAEAANATKSRFLANMSHELRTPMNAILGMIDVALPKATDPTVQDCLRTAKESAGLLLALLNDLLDSAKIESNKLELEAAPFSLRRMLDQVTRVLSVRADEKGLCFSCRIPEKTPDAVLGDRLRLQQVLLNLAGNAIKFTERGDVAVGLHVWVQDGSAWLKFAVRDTGIGIPTSIQEHLFQPFAQGDASMARRFGGTGLGLVISKSLVELMGGRLWFESDPGKGTTFYFNVRLPLAGELPADVEPPAAAGAAVAASLRILLAEDNPANQKLATYVLQDRGHRVDIAADGRMAVELTERNPYDVILMDLQMPGMNGLEATAAIRKRDGNARQVPIIAMTAHAMKADRERCLAAGMDGYLAKPIDAQEMIGLVESLACGAAPPAPLRGPGPAVAEPSPQAAVRLFDPEEARSRCFGSETMVRKMIRCFFGDVEEVFRPMRAALAQGDFEEVGRLGHRIKGTLVYLGAHPAQDAALRVERFGRPGRRTPSEVEDAIDRLERECLALSAALREHPLAAEPTRDDAR